MLILFDVDGTLLRSDGAGKRAMEAAASELLGRVVTCDGIAFGGRLDPGIWLEICARAGEPQGAALHARFRELYARRFLAEMTTARVSALPGVHALLDALAARARGVTLGVLTGNYAETGRAKLDAAGIGSRRFAVAAWGDEAADRPGLVPIALTRWEQIARRPASPRDVVLVGDTPRDVAAAAAHGCRSLAVATGGHGRHELHDCGATLAVDDLTDTAALLAWLGLG